MHTCTTVQLHRRAYLIYWSVFSFCCLAPDKKKKRCMLTVPHQSFFFVIFTVCLGRQNNNNTRVVKKGNRLFTSPLSIGHRNDIYFIFEWFQIALVHSTLYSSPLPIIEWYVFPDGTLFLCGPSKSYQEWFYYTLPICLYFILTASLTGSFSFAYITLAPTPEHLLKRGPTIN